MKHFTKVTRKITLLLTAAALCGMAGCSATDIEVNSPSSWTSIYSSSPSSETGSSAGESGSLSSGEGSSDESLTSAKSEIPSDESTSTEISEPGFSFMEIAPLPIPDSADIKICSVSQALSNFNEIACKLPEGSPGEIVKTLLERNVLCFAAMQGKGWTIADSSSDNSDNSDSVVRINSEYFKSAEQMSDLFYGTYTENQAWRLLHPQDFDGFGDVFRDDNGLCFDTSHLRRYHGESFETETYAGVIEASDEEITFGRYYESDPSGSSAEPNTMLFRAVKENGGWRLENYITDAPAYAEPDIRFKTTARKGNPELMELAKRQVGNIGGEPYWDWYGFSYHMEWCGALVSWCYAQAGKDGPFFTRCNSEGKRWFEENEQWAWADYRDIAPADSIFFDWDLDGSADHVGLVVGTDGENVYTIEGNRDDSCISRFYPLTFECILGYGLMEWD